MHECLSRRAGKHSMYGDWVTAIAISRIFSVASVVPDDVPARRIDNSHLKIQRIGPRLITISEKNCSSHRLAKPCLLRLLGNFLTIRVLHRPICQWELSPGVLSRTPSFRDGLPGPHWAIVPLHVNLRLLIVNNVDLSGQQDG